jgi:YVTN family beta-propeller protein
MSQISSREIRLASRPKGIPAPDNFTLAQTELEPLDDHQVLVRNLFMSVDPYMRGRMHPGKSYVPPFELGKPLEGAAVGEVIESRAREFKPGDAVVSNYGWREYFMASPKELHSVSHRIQPLSLYLGALGMPGMTAWVGLQLAEIKAGEVVYISAAAGAVGNVAGQLAKLRGCRVLGSAGSAEKVRFLRDECGFDSVFNYKAGTVREQLKLAAPDGIDVYFDNVGGGTLEAALSALRVNGRIIACGGISVYNTEKPQPGPSNLMNIVTKRLTMRGFIVSDWLHRQREFEKEVGGHFRAGRLKNKETVVAGIEHAVGAFIGLFQGRNVGKMVVKLGCAILLLAALAWPAWATDQPFLHAPSVDTYAKHDPNGLTILSSGRHLKPVGRHVAVARFPYGLARSRDGKVLFVASDGLGQLITEWREGQPAVAVVMAPTYKRNGKKERPANAGGADFSPDARTLYWSSGETGAIYLFDVASRKQVAEVLLNSEVGGHKYEDSYAVDVKVSGDGKYLYCADVTNFRVVVVDAVGRRVVGSVAVGRYPYALAVVGQRVYAANIGLFEYSPVPPPGDARFDQRGLTFPPFGYPSKEARDGVQFEGRRIPGLGEPNVPESFSVWGVDVSNPQAPKIVSRLKTGLLVGAPSDNGKTVGGSAPNFLTAHGGALFVSNGNNDMIERIDLAQNKIVAKARIVPSPLVARVRGVSPAGMAVSPDGTRLYVAEMGINAIAVLDAQTLTVLGHIPTAWYPYRVAVSPDGRQLVCICFRGFGNGPNAGQEIPKSDFLAMRGVVSVLEVPSDADLKTMTTDVLACNGIVDRRADLETMSSPLIPEVPGKVSKQIKHVVFITKENHTYDTIFDRIPGAKHDPSLLRWGMHQRIEGKGQPTLEDVAVMVNHNALAQQFAVSDNFYMEPEASGVGHRWLVGVQPNNLMQMTYSVGWSFKQNSSAPGRRYAMGSNGSLIPEDYPEAGSMWEHLARNGIRFRNYGEGFEFPGVGEDEDEHPTGAREVVNIPMPKALYDNTCREFPIFNTNIPDQYRAHWFMKDVEKLFLSGKQPFPQFVNIAICNDHGSEPKAEKGYPYLASFMADNDLALGRIVEFLSRTPYWKNMAIFVTQDDSGGEPDHVDALRSVLMVVSPWAKHGHVSHRHTTIVSMHRTLYEIFGLPPLNMFDALANDFADCFTTKPDFRPYKCLPVDPRIFDPEKAKDPKDPDYGKARLLPSISLDDPEEMEKVLRRGEKEARPR